MNELPLRTILKDHLIRHVGSYVRAMVYSLIAGLNVWATAIGDKAGPELWSVLENRWPALLISSVVAIAVTIRAQLDQHIGRAALPKQDNPPPKP